MKFPIIDTDNNLHYFEAFYVRQQVKISIVQGLVKVKPCLSQPQHILHIV